MLLLPWESVTLPYCTYQPPRRLCSIQLLHGRLLGAAMRSPELSASSFIMSKAGATTFCSIKAVSFQLQQLQQLCWRAPCALMV